MTAPLGPADIEAFDAQASLVGGPLEAQHDGDTLKRLLAKGVHALSMEARRARIGWEAEATSAFRDLLEATRPGKRRALQEAYRGRLSEIRGVYVSLEEAALLLARTGGAQ